MHGQQNIKIQQKGLVQ